MRLRLSAAMSHDDDKARAYRKWFRLPATERLITDYSCAISRTILTHGRMFISANFVCFYSNIFGSETKVVIRAADIVSARAASLISIIPNSIEIVTATMPTEPYVFTSFYARDEVLQVLQSIITSPATAAASAATAVAHAPSGLLQRRAGTTVSVQAAGNPGGGGTGMRTPPLSSTCTPPMTPNTYLGLSGAATSPAPPGGASGRSTAVIGSGSGGRVEFERAEDLLILDPEPPTPNLSVDLGDADMEDLFSVDVPDVTPHLIHRLCFAEDAPLAAHDFHASRGDTEFRSSRWARGGVLLTPASAPVVETRAEAVAPLHRTFIFRSPITGAPMGPDSTRIHKHQCAQWFGVDPVSRAASARRARDLCPSSFSSHHDDTHPHLLILDSYISVDAPYGDHFSISDCIELLHLPQQNATRIRVSVAIRFSKFTFLKAVIRGLAQRDVKAAQTAWCDSVQHYIATHTEQVALLRQEQRTVGSAVPLNAGDAVSATSCPARTAAPDAAVAASTAIAAAAATATVSAAATHSVRSDAAAWWRRFGWPLAVLCIALLAGAVWSSNRATVAPFCVDELDRLVVCDSVVPAGGDRSPSACVSRAELIELRARRVRGDMRTILDSGSAAQHAALRESLVALRRDLKTWEQRLEEAIYRE